MKLRKNFKHINADFECTTKAPVEMYLGYLENIENPSQHYFSSSIKEFMFQLYKFKQANVYFHNLDYDGTFIFDFLIGHDGYVNLCVDEYDYGFDKYIVGNPDRFTLYKKCKNDDWIILNFIDTFKAFPTSVKKLGKMVSKNEELLKGDTPLYKNMEEVNARTHEQVEYDQWYCQRDVQIVSEFIRANHGYYLNLFEQNLYTISGIAMKAAKNEIKDRKPINQFKPLCRCKHFELPSETLTWVEWVPFKKADFDIETYYPKLHLKLKAINENLKETFTEEQNGLDRNLKSVFKRCMKEGSLKIKRDNQLLKTRNAYDVMESIQKNETLYHVQFKVKEDKKTGFYEIEEYPKPIKIPNDECYQAVIDGLKSWKKRRPKKKDYQKWIVEHNNFKSSLPNPKKSKITQHGKSVLIEQVNKMIKPHYKGGISWVNPIHQNEMCGHGWTLDVNSMHPGNMRNQKLPGRLRVTDNETFNHDIWKSYSNEEILKQLNDYLKNDNECQFIIFDTLKAKTKEGCMPIFKGSTSDTINENQSYYNDIDFKMFGLTDTEVKYLIDCYDIEECIVDYVLHFERLPKESETQLYEFIDQNYKLKDEYGQKGDEVSRYITKLKLNSFYGQNGFSDKPINQVRWRYHIQNQALMKTKLGEPFLISGKDAYVPVAAWTTAYSRVQIGRTANALGLDNFLYSDTDSVHFLSDIRDRNELEKWCLNRGIEISDSKLGAWKIEEEFEKGKYIRSKTYMEEDSKGVRILHAAGFNGEEELDFDKFRSGYCVKVKRSVIVSGGRQIKDQIQVIDGEFVLKRRKDIKTKITELNEQLQYGNVENLEDEIKSLNIQLNSKL